MLTVETALKSDLRISKLVQSAHCRRADRRAPDITFYTIRWFIYNVSISNYGYNIIDDVWVGLYTGKINW